MKLPYILLFGLVIHNQNVFAQIVIELQHSQAPELRITPYSDQAILSNQSITLNQNPAVTGGTAPYVYSWTPPTGLDNPTSANPVASPTTTTTYTFQVTDSQGCKASRQITIIVENPLNGGNTIAQQAKIYPNPTQDYCMLQWPHHGKVHIEVSDMNGRILQKHIYLNVQDENLRIDLNTLESGIYFINAFDEQLKMQFKVILQ